VQILESIHSVIHPEVAEAYNAYASKVHQCARLKIQEAAAKQARRAEAEAEKQGKIAEAVANGTELPAEALADGENNGEEDGEDEPLGFDIPTALRLQRQAVIVIERTSGVYTHQAAQYYTTLALLENLDGNAKESLRYFRHVLRIWDVLYGPGNPEVKGILVSVQFVQTLYSCLCLRRPMLVSLSKLSNLCPWLPLIPYRSIF
jgi:protein TIF31